MEAFHNLPREKQDAIINAALTLFGKTGYAKTSMADIAAEAGVSKASLFYYFGSKKALYAYLYSMGTNAVLDGVFDGSQSFSPDFFERMHQVQVIKMRVIGRYPGLYSFFHTALAENAPEAENELHQANQHYIRRGFTSLMEGIDWLRFRPGVDMEKLVNIVTWVSEGYVKENLGKKPNDVITQEVFAYLDVLKQAFYKEEYLDENH